MAKPRFVFESIHVSFFRDYIVGHICALHGVTNKLSIKKFIICLIRKRNKDVGDAIEEVLEEEDNKKQN